MSERKVDVEIARKEYTNDAVLFTEADIIDVSVFDFSSQDSWLYIPPLGYQFECSIYDLYTWLEKEPEIILSANKKSIDTRTFTRSKKRSSRCSFESILETLSSPVSNTWRTSNFPNVELNLNKYSNISISNKEEAIPSMLKTTSVANAFPEESATSGQESMEVFLNMSHSKGIDSFINSMESGLSDPLMSVSQPSVLYSSIISFRDDSLCNIECDKGLDASNSMKMCNRETDEHEVDTNETFTKGNNSDNSENYCQNSQDKTITNSSGSSKDLNETFCANASMVVLSNSIKNKSNTDNLSSTYINENESNTRNLESRDNEREETYNSNQKVQNLPALNITQCLMDIGKTNNNGAGSSIKNDRQVNRDRTNELQKNVIHDVTKNTLESSIASRVNSSVSSLTTDIFNSTFKFPLEIPQSTPVHFVCGNSTYNMHDKHLESTPMYNTGLNSTFKAPTLLRKELLAEIDKTGDRALNSTYNHAVRNEKPKREVFDEIPKENEKPPMENRYNTYKKELPTNKIAKACTEFTSEADDCAENSAKKKYYTFTKKSSNHGGKSDMENAESSDNVDATFVKPRPKLPKRRQHIPRIFSKMPQFLQKSNPNLISSSLKTVDTTLQSTNATNFGYMKGSQPNVRDVEKSLANKLYRLEKMRSGSEQRLNTGAGELNKSGTGGSTESIESTQSAHSAPDLDDRLSTCSDSSHNSYTTQPTNIEQLQQIVKMQEESLIEDVTSRWNRRVSENAWVDTKNNLPSPISKNGIDCDRLSPLSADYNFQTSSPLISPIKSSHSNTDGNTTRTIAKQQVDVKNETFSKPTSKIENRTRLPQPTNWNRGSNVTSAIPRPPSRIPGPRFVRPGTKSTQADTKRGCT